MSIKSGFSRKNVTPKLGVPISGYYEARFAKEILDDLYVNATAFDDGNSKAIIVNADSLMFSKNQSDEIRREIAAACGIPVSAVFLGCSHTHTAPMYGPDFASSLKGDEEYELLLKKSLCEVSKEALADCKPAVLSTANGTAENISFVRRFRMKDGGVQTNPGVGNTNIDYPLGQVNNEVKLLKIERENADDIYIVNFGTHPDSIGGEVISGDYPAFVRDTVEKALDGVKCMFITGAQGDVNHINPLPTEADRCGLCYDSFDGVPRGYEHSKHMGRVIAGAVLQICGKTRRLTSDTIAYASQLVTLPSNMDNSRLDEANHIVKLHTDGKDDEIGYTGMELTTVVAEATRIVALQNGPESYDFELTALKIGDVAFAGLPGEPFVEIGRKISEASPFAETFVCCLTNGGDSYFPTSSAYDEGGYEARSSHLKKGGDKILIDGMTQLLSSL